MSFEWIIVDTETTGLQNPIHIIEIAAQRMRGFNAVGQPFHAYLNHSVRIPAEAIAVHGLTQSFIHRKGLDPRKVHSDFEQYLENRPFAAHNLSYDLKCINTERRRLGFNTELSGELCTMLLSRRILPEMTSVRLELIKDHFCFKSRSHRADSDVRLVVRLFEKIFYPRLCLLGINSWLDLKRLSKTTPVSKYHHLISREMEVIQVQRKPIKRKNDIGIMRFFRLTT